MKIPAPQMEMLKQLLVGSIRRENYKPSPIGDSLLRLGFAEFHDFEGIVFFAITAEGRKAYAAQVNSETDQDDAKEDSQTQADPGPLFRMVTHFKEAGMVAFRFGVNSVRAQQPNAVAGVKEQLRPTLEKALGKAVTTEMLDAFATYLLAQMDKGIEAAKNANG